MTETFKCPSWYDDNNTLRDCTCGKCERTETERDDGTIRALVEAAQTYVATNGRQGLSRNKVVARLETMVVAARVELLREQNGVFEGRIDTAYRTLRGEQLRSVVDVYEHLVKSNAIELSHLDSTKDNGEPKA